jgi:hypothetical protein
MNQNAPAKIYEEQLRQFRERQNVLQKKRNRLGWIRLAVFLLTLLLSYEVFAAVGLAGLAIVVSGLGVLLYLVSLDVNNNQQINNTKTLVDINEEEKRLIIHDYYHRYDGSSYLPDQHPYAADLDLFGKASLFQWINRCFTEGGRYLFAKNLLEPLPVEEVHLRHEAVKELKEDVDWRQQWQAYAVQTPVTKETEAKIFRWLQEKDVHFIDRRWKTGVLLYTVVALGSLLACIFGLLPVSLFSTLYLVYLASSLFLSRNTLRPYILLSGIVKEIGVLSQLTRWFDQKTFDSPLFSGLQQNLRNERKTAAEEIGRLKVTLDRFDMRLGIAGFLFFNPFLLWDVRQMIALNGWRKRNKEQLPKWFHTIAQVDVIQTLSTLHFNQPGWCFPQYGGEHFHFKGVHIGHPLLPEENRVANDFTLYGKGRMALITGSNMAGKSTFLRSLGVNTLLAGCGAPVCARELSLSPVQLMTSMRIADNLAENTSTFYAELKKLKTIIEAVNRGEPVFLLLDEILRGTNSLDRHTGSEALVAQLIKHDAAAVIATHDVDLAKLQDRYPGRLLNFHFDVQVEGEELYFDYVLKEGICTSLNASILMKKIGIELS